MTQDMYIYRTQKALYCIRRFAGWTMSDLGDLLGVTKQAISNWERGRTPFQRLQYMGVMTVMQIYITKTPDTSQLLKYTIGLIYDNSISDDNFISIIEKLMLVAQQSSYADMLAVSSMLFGDEIKNSSYEPVMIDPDSDYYHWVTSVIQM